MGPEGIILVNSPITTFQQSLTHSALMLILLRKSLSRNGLAERAPAGWQWFWGVWPNQRTCVAPGANGQLNSVKIQSKALLNFVSNSSSKLKRPLPPAQAQHQRFIFRMPLISLQHWKGSVCQIQSMDRYKHHKLSCLPLKSKDLSSWIQKLNILTLLLRNLLRDVLMALCGL